METDLQNIRRFLAEVNGNIFVVLLRVRLLRAQTNI